MDEKFDKLSNIINKDSDKYKNLIKSTFATHSMMCPVDFRKCIKGEIEQVLAKTPLNQKDASISDYGELFKFIEDVPACLQKPIKKTKDSLRISRSSLCLKDKDSTNVSQTSLAAKSTIEEPEVERKSAKEIYINFRTYCEKIALLKTEMNNSQEQFAFYREELNNLRKFGEQLDKLMPSYDICEDAFTDTEKIKIKNIVQNMEHFNYIQNQVDTYRDLSEDDCCPARLQNLMEIISDALEDIKYV